MCYMWVRRYLQITANGISHAPIFKKDAGALVLASQRGKATSTWQAKGKQVARLAGLTSKMSFQKSSAGPTVLLLSTRNLFIKPPVITKPVLSSSKSCTSAQASCNIIPELSAVFCEISQEVLLLPSYRIVSNASPQTAFLEAAETL